MARKDVNIGLTGNDGTGDSIRDAFAKVNSNFQELYASQGLEAGLTFDNLVDVIKPLRPNTVLGLDSLGKTVVSRDLEASTGVSIDTTSDPSKIIFSIANVQIRQDPNPTLSNNLDAGGFKLSALGDPTTDQDAVTRKWVYQNFLNRDNIDKLGTVDLTAGSVMRQNFKISPTPDNGIINAGNKVINLIGSDGVSPKNDVFLKFQATHPAHATRKEYVDSKLSLQGTETLDPATGFVNKGMGIMTGPLILNDHPGEYVGIDRRPDGTLFVQDDYRAATRGYVDSKTYSSAGNIYVSTKGNDDMWDFANDRPNPDYGYPEEEVGRSWSKAFKSLNAACRYAKRIIDRINLQNIPYQIDPIQVSRVEPPFNPSTEPKTRVRVSLQNHGYVDGDYVQVSGAILGSLDTRNMNGIHRVNALDANNFELDLKSLVTWPRPEVAPNTKILISLANKKDGPYSTISKVDFGFRGFFVPKPEITIMVESGVYFEEAPIAVPPNVAIKGDEFRRTLIRPKQGPVDSARTQEIKFVRGDRSQSATFWYNTHYYHQLARSVGTTNVAGSTKLEIKNSAYRPKSGMRFIVGSTGGVPNVYRVGREVNIVYKEPNPDLNIATGTYIMDIVDENGDLKPLGQSIPDSTTIEFFLDNEHCDCLLVADAFQLRNITILGFKGFAMAFDPSRQIKTRSPYAQVGAVFAGEGGGGQLVDGMAGNQVCYVLDTSYTDPFTGTQGASGLKLTVTGLVRTPETPNTFFLSKKKYVIIDTTAPDANGTATLTLSSTTPIEVDDTYLPAGFIPNGTQILIETAGNRSMLSNDFTMINDLGYGVVCDNNGVSEAVSQFTYYCRASYLSRAGGQIRSVTGSSCYGIIGLQSEGSDPNEAIQIGRIKTDIGNIMTVYIDDPTSEANVGAVGFTIGGLTSPPIRNATFKLTKHELPIKNIARARLSGGSLTTGPLIVTTFYNHPFKTGDSVQMVSIKGLQLPAIPPSTTPRTTDIDGQTFIITVTGDKSFTLNDTESTDYINDLGAYAFADLPARAISNLLPNSQDIVYSIKGDPNPINITGKARFDGVANENSSGQNILKLQQLERPAVVGMRTIIDDLEYTVTAVSQKEVTFKPSPRPAPTGDNDNKIGATTIYIYTTTDITTGAISGTTLTATNLSSRNIGQLVTGTAVAPNTFIIAVSSPTTATVSVSQTITNRTLELSWVPKAGWTFQHLDTNMGLLLNYDRYTIINTPTYDAGSNRWAVDLDVPLTVNMQNQEATGQKTRVDGIWDVTLNYDLGITILDTPTPQQFTFTNSYWAISLDPALANSIPTYLDGFNKPQAFPINLYQQKTISVSQILNRPAIINSSALRFSSSNYDPSIYRILGKTANGGITKDRYAITSTVNPLTGFNVNATQKILANKEWIKAETIAYLATIYPKFQYETSTCARDVGYIIDAVVYDLTYGGNVRSRAAGVSYYQQGNPSAALVLSQQKAETIDAINFATTAAQTALNQYTGATSPQLQLPYRGSNLNGVAQLIANKTFIQEEVIAFLAQSYPGFNYDEDKCRRDVGLIVNAVLDDVILGTNYRTVTAGLAYIRSYSSNVTTLQKTQTIAGINKARDLVNALITDLDTQTAISANMAIVTSIINAVNANAAPSLTFSDPLNTNSGIINAHDVLRANRTFIQNEIVAYINENFVGYTYSPAVQTKCERDLGYIIDAIGYDLALGTNFNAVVQGRAYQRANSAYVTSEQKVQTLAGMRKAKSLVLESVSADPLAVLRATQGFDTVIDMFLNGTNTAIVWSDPIGVSASSLNARNQLINNRTFIQDEIVAYVNANNPPAGIDTEICGRDAGYIVDALCYDVVYGGNSASIVAAEAYFVGTNAVISNSGEINATVAAWTRLQNVVSDVIQGITVTPSVGNTTTQDTSGSVATASEASFLSSRVQIIKDVITAVTLSVLPATINPSASWASSSLQTAQSDLDTDKPAILTATSTYLSDAFSGFTYNSATCSRDVGYVVDAMSYDILYGGNSQTVSAANSYYLGAQIYVPDQEEVTAFTYEYLKDIVQDIIQNIAITPTTGNTSTQDTSLTAGSSAAALAASNLTQIFVDVIRSGVVSAPTSIPPTLSNGVNFAAKGSQRVLILQSEEAIKNGVITFLNATYAGGFQYNQTTCRRDVGLIIDAIAYDLEYGGNVASRTAGLEYYNGTASAAYVLANQKSQTIAALNRASAVAQQVVLEVPVTRTTGNNEVQNTSGTPGVAGVDNARVLELMTIVTNIIQNGSSAAPTRELGIRRTYQDPLDPDYVPQSIDSGVVAEAGAALAVQGLMNQITAIIEFGTTGGHIVVQQQVLDTLQSIDFPPTATSLQYGAVLKGPGIPKAGDPGVAEDTFIRTVTQLFDANQNTIGYRARISAIITQAIPAGTEISVTGPGSDYLFDLNTALDNRHLAGDVIGITTTFSTVRATGHDFLNVGAGGYDDSNYPNNVYGPPVNTPSSGSLVKEVGTGRVFHVSTDQDGNFRVGSYFNVNQGDGSVSISAKIGLTAVTALSFLTGASVNQFSTDTKLDDNSDNIVSTQRAIKTYINSLINGRFEIDNTDTPQRGLLRLDGDSVMVGNLDMGVNTIERLDNSPNNDGGVNRKYVDNVFAGGLINYDGSFEIETTGRRTDVLAFTMIADDTSVGGVPNNKGGIDLNTNKILRLKAPTQSTDAANKEYVDQTIATGGVRTGWSGFTLSNTTIRNTVTSVSMQNNGGGYTVPPVVVFYSTSGTGAAARAVLTAGSGARSVNNIIVDSGGYGYTEAPIIIIGGSVASVTVTNSGTGYSGTPTIQFSNPTVLGGVRATGYVVMQGTGVNQIINRVVITNAGAGYSAPPTITITGGGIPSVPAVLTSVLQGGSGATAVASITATPRNIDLNGNKVTGSADPTANSDLVTLNYFNTKNFVGEIADVTITGTPASGDILVFTGTTPTGSKGAMVNASIAGGSDVSFTRSTNSVTISIKTGVIDDGMVKANANIQQSKIALNKAGGVAEGTVPAASNFGIAAVNNVEFVSDNGFIRLRQSENKNTGVRLDRIQQISNYRLLGRYNTTESETSTGTITEVPVNDLKNLLGLSSSSVQVLISDDILGGRQVDTGTALSPSLATNWNGSVSYGALLRRGGEMIGKIVMTDSGGLPAGDPGITPIIGVKAGLGDKLDIGSSGLRFRNIYSKNYYGDVFQGTTFGSATAPTSQGGGAVFNGTATYAGSSGALQFGLDGTGVGSGDIAIRAGANSVTFNGSQACTISILADSTSTSNSIVRRTSDQHINAVQFNGALNGLAASASALRSGTTDYAPSDTASSNNTIPVRINGVIRATTFEGKATSANYADLAENYQADAAYEPGTVLEFGGEFEVTIAEDETRRVAGVVSTNPAHLMNTQLTGDNVVALALQGRVPCKVRGKIRKGDLMVSGGGGYARPTQDPKIGTIIGKALENFDGVEGVIEIVVGRL